MRSCNDVGLGGLRKWISKEVDMMGNEMELNVLYKPKIHQEKPENRPGLILISMVKNEGDIISAWTSHVCSLFDAMFIVDHMSSDGTREFLLEVAAETQKVYLYSFDHPGYFQEEITNRLAQMASDQFRHQGCWLFPLDADEFLDVASKAFLVERVREVSVDRVLRMHWKNCVPLQLSGDEEFSYRSPCLIPPARGMYKKLSAHSWEFVEGRWRFTQGNHEILNADGELVHHDVQTDFCDILHVPLRNLDQFVLKCVQGYHAYKALPSHRKREGQGSHWFNMITSIAKQGTLDPSVVREHAAHYGQPHLSGSRGLDIYAMIDELWTCSSLEVAHVELWKQASRSRGFMTLANDLVARANGSELEEFMNVVRRCAESRLPQDHLPQYNCQHQLSESGEEKVFGRLSENSVAETMLGSEMAQFCDFITHAFLPHQSPTPSAWESHVPFLFCLLHYTKPRRFVELGSHYGNSYFAACQASHEMDWAIECVAIDTWQGDEHAGRYGEDVFQQFAFILERDYRNCGKYIRKTFDEASQDFGSNSIDLLHIDGLHTYEAVSHDFKTWLPKMSDRGIIMFHDTQVYDREFGVWKLWKEIRDLYPSFEFEQGYGLGVLLIGKKVPPRIQGLFHLLAKRENLKLMRVVFSGLGKLSPIRYSWENTPPHTSMPLHLSWLRRALSPSRVISRFRKIFLGS